MSIEAMKLALEAIQDLRGYRPDIDKAIDAIRTAIQQAEAQQPVTGEPVAGEWYCGNCRVPVPSPASHPAPSVSSLIEKAISSGHFGVLPIKATIPMCKAGWGASGGELTFQQIGHIYEEMYKARPLPDDSSTG